MTRKEIEAIRRYIWASIAHDRALFRGKTLVDLREADAALDTLAEPDFIPGCDPLAAPGYDHDWVYSSDGSGCKVCGKYHLE